MVAEGERGHFQLRGAADQFRDAARAIEQAVLGMDVQVDEGFRRGHEFILGPIERGAR